MIRQLLPLCLLVLVLIFSSTAQSRKEMEGAHDPNASHAPNAHQAETAAPDDAHANHSVHDAEALAQQKLDALFPDVHAPRGEPGAPIRVDEQIGEKIPGDLTFRTATGEPVELESLLGKPTLMLPIFFHCPRTCAIMLASLASAANANRIRLGKDYRIIAFSFDEEETLEQAQKARANTFPILKEAPADGDWLFLSGNRDTILRLTGSLGFSFRKVGPHSFIHPNAVMALAPDGTIIRYLYGPNFLPFDVGLAISEADAGRPGVSIKKVLSFCFDFDPTKRRYTLNLFRISGTVILLMIAAFAFFLFRKRSANTVKNRTDS